MLEYSRFGRAPIALAIVVFILGIALAIPAVMKHNHMLV